MADNIIPEIESDEILNRAKGFWEKNSKNILMSAAAFILIVGGYLGYKNFIQIPNEQKAQEEIFRAEENFRRDSLSLALNGCNL